MMCFRHPSIATLERYFLPFPPNDIPGKCFVSLPRRQAAELARQQAEVLGVGRLEKKSTVSEAKPEEMPEVAESEETKSMDAMMDAFSTDLMAGIVAESDASTAPESTVELPVAAEKSNNESTAEPEHVFVPLPPGAQQDKPSPPPSPQPEVISEPASTTVKNENVPMPEVVEEVGEPMSDIEVEFRELVNGLLAAGVDPTEMMDDPRWEEINERATAVGFETWPVFLELATME
jgi:hypothetical protein